MSQESKEIIDKIKKGVKSDIELFKLSIISGFNINNNKKEPFYANQLDVILKLVDQNYIEMYKINMIIGLTQSGKTGLILAYLWMYYNNINRFSNIIPLENIFIITGLSSKEWTNQTTERMPKMLENNIFHNNKLDKFKEKFNNLKNKKNILIFIDEVQFASQKKNKPAIIFKELGLNNLDNLKNNNINIIELTATPNGTLSDLNKWSEGTSVDFLLPGENYIGPNELLENKKIINYQDITNNLYNIVDKMKIIPSDLFKYLDNIYLQNEFIKIAKNHNFDKYTKHNENDYKKELTELKSIFILKKKNEFKNIINAYEKTEKLKKFDIFSNNLSIIYKKFSELLFIYIN